MKQFQTTIDIGAPVETVWRTLSDVEHWHEWTASIRRIEILDAKGASESERLAVGGRARVEQPKLPTTLYEVTAWDPPRRFEWINRSLALRVVANHTIDPIAIGSRVKLTVTFEGWLAWVVAPLAGKLTAQYIELEANGLKRRCEESANTAG